jgi:hypothetical protein
MSLVLFRLFISFLGFLFVSNVLSALASGCMGFVLLGDGLDFETGNGNGGEAGRLLCVLLCVYGYNDMCRCLFDALCKQTRWFRLASNSGSVSNLASRFLCLWVRPSISRLFLCLLLYITRIIKS